MFHSVWIWAVLLVNCNGVGAQYFVQESPSGDVRLVCRDCNCASGGRAEVFEANKWTAVSNCESTVSQFNFLSICARVGYPNPNSVDPVVIRPQFDRNMTIMAPNTNRIFIYSFISCPSSETSFCDCGVNFLASAGRQCGVQETSRGSLDVFLRCHGHFAGICVNTSNPWSSQWNNRSTNSQCNLGQRFRKKQKKRVAEALSTTWKILVSWVGVIIVYVFFVKCVVRTDLRPISLHEWYSTREGGEWAAKMNAELNVRNSVLEQDFVDGKVVFFDNIYQDLFLYYRCEHPLIGGIWPPKGHPFSFKERWAINAAAWATNFFCSWILLTVVGPDAKGFGSVVVAFLFASVPLKIIDIVLNKFAICKCCIKTNEDDCCYKYAEYGHRCGHVALCVGVLAGFCLFVLAVFASTTSKNLGPALILWFGSIVGDWAMTSNILLLFFFAKDYRAQKKNKQMKDGQKMFFLTYEDYKNDHMHGQANTTSAV